MEIAHELLINAPVDRVWALTVDIEHWPELTSTMTSVGRLDDGELTVGSTARVVQPLQRPRTWTVRRLDPGSRFEWSTKVAWLTMTGGHRLVATANGCRNTLTVEITGVGGALVTRLIGSKIRQAIATENEGFKQAAELSSTAERPAHN